MLVYSFEDPPDSGWSEFMEFHLVYNGELLRSSSNGNSRAWEKHQIRRALHSQLVALWATNPVLSFYSSEHHTQRDAFATKLVHHDTTPRQIAERWEGFVPVVNADFGMFCELDILFLRAEPTGRIIKRDSGGGDIDNRIKTLLDALCIPQRGQIKPKADDTPDPKPMYVLMSDDSQVTSLRVTADRLLTTVTDDASEACAVVRVKACILDPTKAPYGMPI